MALERPEHLVAVSSAAHESKSAQTARNSWRFLFVFLWAQFFPRAAFDRVFVFPSSIAAKTKEEVVLEENLQKRKNLLLEKASAQNAEMRDALDITKEDFPRLKTEMDSSGGKKQFLICPKDCGLISIDSSVTTRAVGSFLLHPESKITFSFRHSVTPAGILDNITNLKFARIDYAGNFFTTNKTIEILSKIEHLEWLGLRGCEITSLKPIYGNAILTRLELESTPVQAAGNSQA